MNADKLQELFEDYEFHLEQGNESAINYLVEENSSEMMSMGDVLQLFHLVIYPLMVSHTQHSLELSRMRIRAVVNNLPEDIQNDIYKEFEEAGDSLFDSRDAEEE